MWDMFVNWIFSCIEWFHGFVGDWGLSIIIVTVIIRLIITPITYRQYKSTYLMNKLQPKIKQIQAQYATDQKRMSEEMQKVYKEAHFNPLSGCLPMIIQMPIFIALFQALQSIGERAGEGATLCFYGIVPDLTKSISVVFPEQGFVAALPYIVLVALFAVSMFIPTLISGNKDKQNMLMMGIMGVMMLFIAVPSPGGVLLFWDVSSIIGIATQLLVQHHYKKRDKETEEEEELIIPVSVERKEKKARPKKSR